MVFQKEPKSPKFLPSMSLTRPSPPPSSSTTPAGEADTDLLEVDGSAEAEKSAVSAPTQPSSTAAPISIHHARRVRLTAAPKTNWGVSRKRILTKYWKLDGDVKKLGTTPIPTNAHVTSKGSSGVQMLPTPAVQGLKIRKVKGREKRENNL